MRARTEAERWADEPWTMYLDTKRERDNLRRWLRRAEKRADRNRSLTVHLTRAEIRAALSGKPFPRKRRKS